MGVFIPKELHLCLSAPAMAWAKQRAVAGGKMSLQYWGCDCKASKRADGYNISNSTEILKDLCSAATATQDSIMRELAYMHAPKPLPRLTVSVARWWCRHSGTLERLGGSRSVRSQRVSTCSLHQHPQARFWPVCGKLKSSLELPS